MALQKPSGSAADAPLSRKNQLPLLRRLLKGKLPASLHIIATCTLVLRENRSSKGGVEKPQVGKDREGLVLPTYEFRVERGMNAPTFSFLGCREAHPSS